LPTALTSRLQLCFGSLHHFGPQLFSFCTSLLGLGGNLCCFCFGFAPNLNCRLTSGLNHPDGLITEQRFEPLIGEFISRGQRFAHIAQLGRQSVIALLPCAQSICRSAQGRSNLCRVKTLAGLTK
jgi:hypothetical protein